MSSALVQLGHCECCNFAAENGSHYVPVRCSYYCTAVIPSMHFSHFLGSDMRLCRNPVVLRGSINNNIFYGKKLNY